jgi:ABC-type polysaccharide/polyol phosphate export permease
MFVTQVHSTKTRSMFGMLAVAYHTTVHDMRGGHRNAVVSILLEMLRGLTLVIVFFAMFMILGMSSPPVRGDYMVYIMTGVFVYLTHITSVTAIMSAQGSTSSMMMHPPMNTMIAIGSAAIATLYKQIITVIVVLAGYHIVVTPITIDRPLQALGMFIVAWFTGCAVGLILMALKPWFPNAIPVIKQLYTRANMIASGKMFLANALPASMVAVFDWNPLFHIIDQIRGYTFLHYNPFQSSLMYPIYVGIALLMIGLMIEFFTRQHVSVSWSAGR